MAGREQYPVSRGKTFFGRSQTVPSTYDYRTLLLEGIEATFKHTDPDDPKKVLSNRTIKATLQRNVSGGTVYGKYGVKPATGYEGRRFDAVTDTVAEAIAGVVDDHLWSAGCRDDDLCWILTEGPVYAKFAGGTSLAVGDVVYAAADGAGKFTNWATGFEASTTDLTDGTLASKLLNGWGRALQTGTTGQSDVTKLIDLQVKK